MARYRSATIRTAAVPAIIIALLLSVGGCASPGHAGSPVGHLDNDPAPDSAGDIYDSPSNGPAPNVVRTGRYQLVPLAPTSGQRDLLLQAVTIDLPQSIHLTVRDGLVHVLRDSGLRLCSRQAQTGLFSQPLPAVHRELGPTTLSDALQVLAGPAWRLHVDFAARTVCFMPRDQSAITVAASNTSH